MSILFNLGCKVNQYEGTCLLKKFDEQEDVVIVNTCCVTHEAETKSLRKFRAALRKYPHCHIIVTGCSGTLFPSKFKGAHEIIDLTRRNQLISGVFAESDRSRYFLKIQDGCNSTCTYCIVAKVRNIVQSKDIPDVVREIRWAVAHGYHEVVLVGANIGLYGREHGRQLVDLVKNLAQVSDLPRIRLSSIEPHFVNDELLRALKDIPLCRHFHIPIQSADDGVLSAMGRTYTSRYLHHMVERIRKEFSSVMLGADVIVGFPGEGEREFRHTYRFINTCAFAHIHVFPYSPRPLTEAFALADPVSQSDKRKRRLELTRCVAQHNLQFRKDMIGKTFAVIVEKGGATPVGVTDNYVRVTVKGRCTMHSLVETVITGVTEDSTIGRPVAQVRS